MNTAESKPTERGTSGDAMQNVQDVEDNAVLAWFQAHIGGEMTGSPSGVGRWLRGTLRSAEAGALVAEFTVREEMTNPMGILHGGMVAVIADELIGAAVFSLNRPYFYTSINLTVDFLHSARLGDVVVGSTTLTRAGQTVINAECTLHNADGTLLARASSNLLRTRVPTDSSGSG